MSLHFRFSSSASPARPCRWPCRFRIAWLIGPMWITTWLRLQTAAWGCKDPPTSSTPSPVSLHTTLKTCECFSSSSSSSSSCPLQHFSFSFLESTEWHPYKYSHKCTFRQWACACMCVCVCVCACTCVLLRTCMCVCVFMYSLMAACVHMHAILCMWGSVCTCFVWLCLLMFLFVWLYTIDLIKSLKPLYKFPIVTIIHSGK